MDLTKRLAIVLTAPIWITLFGALLLTWIIGGLTILATLALTAYLFPNWRRLDRICERGERIFFRV